MKTAHIPSATYRVQLNADVTLLDAAALVPYLAALGISDVYLSPILTPRQGSTHGYDIVDHQTVNPALGGEEGLAALATALRTHGMGLILDVVPNHMGIGDTGNAWWMDVLENGAGSIYADYFDIDWHPVRTELSDKVVLPILGDQYGDVLERGEFRLHLDTGAFFITYYNHWLPVAPRSYAQILAFDLEALTAELGELHPHVQELHSILTAIGYLPPRGQLAPAQLYQRNREKEIIKRRIATLYSNSPAVRHHIDTTITIFNGIPGDPASFDLLDRLLNDQAYRPAFWRVAAEEINYRRFFDINELAAIRVELPEVFAATHQMVFRLLAEGVVTGLRIDHPDGLRDPAGYFRQLQNTAAQSQKENRETLKGDTPVYIVAEKILAAGETLREDWPIAGTTGYDFLNVVNGLFVNPAHVDAFDAIYHDFTAQTTAYPQLVNATKKMIMLISLVSEINELSVQLERLAEHSRRYRDFTLGSLTFALREVLACLPIYRTYLTAPDTAAPHDQRAVETAIAEAKRRNPRTATSIFDFLRDTLLLRNLDRFPSGDAARVVAFALKVQQVSGPVMAKGVEDTAFYVYNRLLSLNDVGGHPQQFGGSAHAFHQHNAAQQAHWPHTMLASSTHDTKRSEDVRARINVLSELPNEWRAALDTWSTYNAAYSTNVDGVRAPSRNDEYLLYQTLLGAWPLASGAGASAAFRARIVAYMEKATKEAKQHTSWINPNPAYDQAVRHFVDAVLAAPLPDAMQSLARRVASFGQWNALAQTLLKLTAPGVPDTYQGCELWDFSLVDPDNRRAVDYGLRRAILTNLVQRCDADGADRRALAAELLDTSADGRIKLFLIQRTLAFRRAYSALFSDGAYTPLHAYGTKCDHVVAFRRTHGDQAGLIVAPRMVVGLTDGQAHPPIGANVWGDTWLALPDAHADEQYRDVFTGVRCTTQRRAGASGLALAEVCAYLPFALLQRISPHEHRAFHDAQTTAFAHG